MKLPALSLPRLVCCTRCCSPLPSSSCGKNSTKPRAKEAGAAATVFRLTQGVDRERGAAIREATTNYLETAIASDWPAMESGKQSPATTEALNEIYQAVLKFQSLGTDERLVLGEILRNVDRISEARRERLVMADGVVRSEE